jgi:hypothetical protein
MKVCPTLSMDPMIEQTKESCEANKYRQKSWHIDNINIIVFKYNTLRKESKYKQWVYDYAVY